MLERFNLMVTNVQKRFDRVKRRDNNNNGYINRVDQMSNHDRRLERHANHNLDDFEDGDDVVGDGDFEHEIVGHEDDF